MRKKLMCHSYPCIYLIIYKNKCLFLVLIIYGNVNNNRNNTREKLKFMALDNLIGVVWSKLFSLYI